MQVPMIDVKNLTVAYGAKLIQEKLTFSVQEKEIFIIMGGSGCGKSSLLRVLMGGCLSCNLLYNDCLYLNGFHK